MYDTTYTTKAMPPSRSIGRQFLRELLRATPAYLFVSAVMAALQSRKA